jgi:CIC family chloride channel protein
MRWARWCLFFLASVTGVTVFTTIMGGGAVLATPPYHVVDHWAILFMVGLGVLVAGVGYLYTAGLTWSEDFFDRLPLPFWGKALAGGLAVGAIGLALPEVLGVGYPTMHRALDGALVLGTLGLLFVAKYVATLITIGAGGSGGVFAPSLFIGGMFGGLYGALIHLVAPGWAPHPAIYAVAGMAAMFSAAAQAPFVAITILLEITGDYHLTAPVMAAAAVSYFIYGYFTRDSMYTVKLRRRGIAVLRGNDVRPIEQIAVQAAMAEDAPPPVAATDTIDSVYDRLMRLHRAFLPVADGGGRLVGLVTLTSLDSNHAANQGSRPVGEVMTPMPNPLWATDSLDTALRRFALEEVVALPVRRGPRGEVAGWVTRDDVIRAYNASTLRTLGTAQQVHALSAAESDPGRFFEVVLPAKSPLVGRLLQEVRLPKSALVVSLVRKNARIIPHGHTALESGDRLLVYVAPAKEAETVRAALEGREGVQEPTTVGSAAPQA